MGEQCLLSTRDILNVGGGGQCQVSTRNILSVGRTVSSVYKKHPQCGGTVSGVYRRDPQRGRTVSGVYRRYLQREEQLLLSAERRVDNYFVCKDSRVGNEVFGVYLVNRVFVKSSVSGNSV